MHSYDDVFRLRRMEANIIKNMYQGVPGPAGLFAAFLSAAAAYENNCPGYAFLFLIFAGVIPPPPPPIGDSLK